MRARRRSAASRWRRRSTRYGWSVGGAVAAQHEFGLSVNSLLCRGPRALPCRSDWPGPANPTDTVKHVARDTAANSPTGQTHVVPQPPPPPTNRNASNGGASAKPRIDVAHAFDALDNLMLNTLNQSTAVLVRDSALAFYNAAGIGQKDKAYAAFVVGHAFFELNDRPTGCRYIRAAVDLDPANPTYPTVLGQCPN